MAGPFGGRFGSMPGPGFPKHRSGIFYDSAMGDVKEGSVQFDKKGPGIDHYVVYGDGGHFSWDQDSQDNVSGVHDTVHKK